ncbi:MAG: hypothetical protein DRJ31_08595 [Candidatus Methanomethylicota archaeon]|uniref:Uncharacterized protein n=1 Tax=Thermoproteota archaeon TaxID=2056631 RepID=A0A497ELE7_9CREN|nr:MAG: hypothetical protein DRJ31_08595 [Candidatus Verstraetearchaeota archaeon]
MVREVSIGRCIFCNGTFSKGEMTKHLKSCKQRKVMLESSSKKKSLKTKIFHVMVEGRFLPQYWLHLEASANATLKDLDEFLRDIWVECCGHMSAFTIRGVRYVTGAGIDSMWMEMGFVPGGRDMNVPLKKVLSPRLKFYYEYDFGTPTELVLKVVAERKGEITGKPIQLLARNEPPLIRCEVCGKIATWVCSQCIGENKGWLCDKCARKHKCGKDMLLPVVNSPRVGMCGYTGEK